MTIQRYQAIRFARTALLTSILVGSFAGTSTADTGSTQQLKPGVRPGDVVILRRVEPVPVGRSDRHAGPIESRVNARDSAMDLQQRLPGVQAISLSDDRAAGIRSSVQGPVNSLHRALGTDSKRTGGAASHGASSSRVTGSLGGGRAGGRVTSVTSGLSGTIGKALSPLTGRN
ncbi:hypothetical protein SAMN04488129_106114 [Halomonas daqiaonensis]|uniref:TonB-dependent Receptor Plug Domain n=1 Tax=Halomonas daqiaonensis TaxID=650850 RepID=A0A1H7M1S2_9GAMM|nr:hypothetical protein SAMN04488129_106114 [Halomonas daqiaonensis]